MTTAQQIKALTEALTNIRELNMTGADENGQRWAHSDLIEQEIIFALAAVQAPADDAQPVQPPDDRLRLSDQYQRIYDQACDRVALDEAHGLPQRMGEARAEVKPVAWRMDYADGGRRYTDSAADVAMSQIALNGAAATPLYDHPSTGPIAQDAARLPEARGKLHDLMCLPKDADLEVARQWAREAYDLLS